MQNLYYFRSVHGNRLLFGACEIMRIDVSRTQVVVYTNAGCPFAVVSQHPELVIKEPPRRVGGDIGYQFNRYEKLVED